MIEDHFPAGRPAWEIGGATLVADVAPFEAMKLRLLNGSHSALAYLGYLAGYQTVAETMRDPGIASFVQALMVDASETLTLPAGWDVAAYQRSLIARYHNPALKHRTWQIAMDGSQKLPQRLLGPIRDRLAQGRPIDRHAFAVAAWMRYAAGTDEAGNTIDVRDPLASRIRHNRTQRRPSGRTSRTGAARAHHHLRRRPASQSDFPRSRYRGAVSALRIRLTAGGGAN